MPDEVSDSFMLDGNNVNLNLLAGPFLRVDTTGVMLEVAGQSLDGDFSFEQRTRSDGGRVVLHGLHDLDAHAALGAVHQNRNAHHAS